MKKAVAIIGYKKSGKTQLVLQLLQYFKAQNLKVAAAKFSQHGFDQLETDTTKFSRWADAVLGLSDNQSFIQWTQKKYLADLIPLLESDLLLIEGGKHLGFLPKVIVPRSDEDLIQLDDGTCLAAYGSPELSSEYLLTEDIHHLANIIWEKSFLLPGLDCGSCGYENCLSLAQEIISGKAKYEDCQAIAKQLTVKINGHDLAMNPFVRSIIGGALQGMLSNLKGYASGNIDIHMEI